MGPKAQTTALIASQPTAPVSLPGVPSELEGFTGYEGMSTSTWIIPRISIVQPMSKHGTPGSLRVNLTGDEFSKLEIIVIKCIQGRVLWDKANPGTEEALCRSFDFLHPDSSIKSPPSSLCAKMVSGVRGGQLLKTLCPKAVWGVDKERPACDETYNLLCLLSDDQLPFWISLRGTSIASVKKYLSAIAIRRLPLCMFSTELSLEERTNIGRHYVAKFSSPKPISKEFESTIIPIINGLKDVDFKRSIEVEEEAMESDGVGMDTSDMPEDEPGYNESIMADARSWVEA